MMHQALVSTKVRHISETDRRGRFLYLWYRAILEDPVPIARRWESRSSSPEDRSTGVNPATEHDRRGRQGVTT